MGSCVLKVKFQLLQLHFVAILQYQQARSGESQKGDVPNIWGNN